MKNKKGFTMIELLAVILILSMIVLVSLPALVTTLNQTDQKEYEQFEKTIFLAAESYFQRNIDQFPQLAYPNGRAAVAIDTLITEGFIRQGFINPNTKEPINHTASIFAIVGSNGILEYTFEASNLSHTGYVSQGMILMYDSITKMHGNRITDLSGNKYDAIIRGTNNTTTWENSRVKFNGIDHQASQTIPIVSEFTIEIVFSNNIDAANPTVAGLFSVNNWTNEITDYPAMKLNYNKTSKSLQFQALVPATNSIAAKSETIGSVSASNLNTVNTYTIVRKTGSFEIYFNNQIVEIYNDTAFMSRFQIPMLRFTLGTWASYYTEMELYAFRIYNKALTFDEIAVNYDLDQRRF